MPIYAYHRIPGDRFAEMPPVADLLTVEAGGCRRAAVTESRHALQLRLLLVVWLAPPIVVGLIQYVDSSPELQHDVTYATSGTWLEEAVGEALVGRSR